MLRQLERDLIPLPYARQVSVTTAAPPRDFSRVFERGIDGSPRDQLDVRRDAADGKRVRSLRRT